MKLTIKKQVEVEQETELNIELPAFFRDRYTELYSMIREDGMLIQAYTTLVAIKPNANDCSYYQKELNEVIAGVAASKEDFYTALEKTLTAIAAAADRLVSVSAFPEPADFQTV